MSWYNFVVMKFNFGLFKKVSLIFSIIFMCIIAFIFLFYFVILPKTVESRAIVGYAQKFLSQNFNMDLEVQGQHLKTFFEPRMVFEVKDLTLKKDSQKLLELTDFELDFAYFQNFKKEIKLNKLCAKNLILKADKLLAALPNQQNQQTQEPFDFKINLLNSKITLDNFELSYLQNKTLFELFVKDAAIKTQNEMQNLEFKMFSNISKDGVNLVKITADSKGEVKFLKDAILVDDFDVLINNSKLKLSSQIDTNTVFVNAKSDKFYLADVFDLVNCDLFIPNGSAMLLPLKSPRGNVKFDVDMMNQDLSGVVYVNNTSAQIKDVSNIPINVSKGQIKITKDKIDFLNLEGYWGKNKSNKVTIAGDIKDYYKTFDSNIEINSTISNEFFKDYLATLINNTVLYVSEPSRTKIIYKSKNNIMDIIWFAQISKGVNFGLNDEKSALSDYDRAVLGQFQIKGDKLEIKNINYYIASDIVRGVKLTPILILNGLMDLTGKLDKIGIAFGREMPCEFLNVFAGQKMFKKGTIKGNIDVVFKNDIPYLDANMQINKTFIPSQRMMIESATLKTANQTIDIDAKGRFKKANYIFKGKIKNELKPPFVIKNLALDVDNLDIERVLASFNNQQQNQEQVSVSDDEISDDDFMFDTKLLRIEDCDFTLQNGKYKELTFGNIKANLTLDDKGVLRIQSNKFDIAQGISTLKVECDLAKLKYYIRLGVKEIDSNLMTKVLFNLDKEITGAASGLIELYGDETLKLNGDIKFLVNEGTIGKIGLVEYVMKIASVFRNPIVMISPATIMDIVSIPEGKFDKIEGVIKIKDNVLSMINIKSYSSSLSALIRGKFDMERHDASLRIYTRFSTDKKTMFGVLRNISLNSLANKVKMNTRNDANYYESELKDLPNIDVDEDKTQVFLTQVEGDIEHYNFLSSLKKIK